LNRTLHEEVDRLLPRLKRHKRLLSFVLALSGKTVGAVEITCMSDIEAERLDDIVIFPITRRHVAIRQEGYSISEYCSLDCDSTLAPECDPSNSRAG